MAADEVSPCPADGYSVSGIAQRPAARRPGADVIPENHVPAGAGTQQENAAGAMCGDDIAPPIWATHGIAWCGVKDNAVVSIWQSTGPRRRGAYKISQNEISGAVLDVDSRIPVS